MLIASPMAMALELVSSGQNRACEGMSSPSCAKGSKSVFKQHVRSAARLASAEHVLLTGKP